MTSIDSQTRRRATRSGLTAFDPARASLGYTLFAPLYGQGLVDLLDAEGRSVHQWHLPFQPGLYGHLLPNGNLFYGGQVQDDTPELFHLWNHFKGGVLLEVDPEGRVVWEHRDPRHHHDARRTEQGGAIYLTVDRVPEAIAAKVQGGIPGSGPNGLWADVIVEVDAAGRRIWEWKAWEHLDPAIDLITANDPRDEWSHGNTLAILPGNRLLVSFRNISTVLILEKSTGQILWRLGHDVLAQQHDPSLLDNGNVLVFDNGANRKEVALPYSRVIEVDPATNAIVWEYHDQPLYNFFSPYISGARRLPNGNTLITEGNFGRIFQVTPEGDTVWEFINPHYHQSPDGSLTNAVFRAVHHLAGDIPWLPRVPKG